MKPPKCPYCGYDLRGLDEATRDCPECGKLVEVRPFALPARRFPIISMGRDVGLAVLVSVLFFVVVVAMLPNTDSVWILVFGAAPGIITFILAREKQKRALRVIPDLWPLELRVTARGLFVVEADSTSKHIDFATDWIDMQFVDHIRIDDARAVIRIKSSRAFQHGWYELDCDVDTAQRHVNNINWLRAACWRAKRNPVTD